jgi:hypothetical protein
MFHRAHGAFVQPFTWELQQYNHIQLLLNVDQGTEVQFCSIDGPPYYSTVSNLSECLYCISCTSGRHITCGLGYVHSRQRCIRFRDVMNPMDNPVIQS